MTEQTLIVKLPHVLSTGPNHVKASVTIGAVERWNRVADDYTADLSTVDAASVNFGVPEDDLGIALCGPVKQIGRPEGSSIKMADLVGCLERFSRREACGGR